MMMIGIPNRKGNKFTIGRERLKIAMAIVIGIVCGGFFAFLISDDLFYFDPFQWSRCEDTESLNGMKLVYTNCHSDNFDLHHEIWRLNHELTWFQQTLENSQREVLRLGLHQNVGPVGTVRSFRTNVAVVPDDTVNSRLARMLRNLAVNREVLVAIANSDVKDMLEVWFSSIKRVGIPNYLVVALDEGIANFCQQNRVPYYERCRDGETDHIGRTIDNHVISVLKFRILREFLQLGYSVLLSDVDVVFLKNPFDHLHRDSDIESMTDGHDNLTAYGLDDVFHDPEMGWSGYTHTFRLWMYNSGFFFIRSTLPSIELLDRVAGRLSREKGWEQAVFNEELFFPSRPGYEGLHASRRTLDFYLFMNSKVLFNTVKKDARFSDLKPVIVHVNYHPDKLTRMEAVVEYFVNGKQDALDAFPVGSES